MNAVAIRLLGEPQWALVVLNSFAALWTVLVAYVLARACFGRLAAKVTAVLVALFPSMILWSVLNIRDSIATLGVTILVYMAVRLHGRPRLSDVAFLAIGLIALSAIRDYVGVLVLGGLGLGMAASFRPDRVGSTFGIGIVLMLVLVFSLQQGGILGTESLENPLESASRFRSGLQADAGPLAERLPLGYYRNKSLRIIRNDALDRFGTPLEQRFTKVEIADMLNAAGMERVRFSENAPFWHCLSRRADSPR